MSKLGEKKTKNKQGGTQYELVSKIVVIVLCSIKNGKPMHLERFSFVRLN